MPKSSPDSQVSTKSGTTCQEILKSDVISFFIKKPESISMSNQN